VQHKLRGSAEHGIAWPARISDARDCKGADGHHRHHRQQEGQDVTQTRLKDVASSISTSKKASASLGGWAE
jgi:hypothetical protein